MTARRRPGGLRLRDQAGQALVVAVIVMGILAVGVSTVLTFTAGNQRNASYSKATQIATALASSGIDNAAAVLSTAAQPTSTSNTSLIPNSSCTSTLLPSTLATANSTTYSTGTVKWWGSFANASDCQNWIWTLHAQSTVANPTGSTASAIAKTATAQVQVNPPTPSTFQVGVWNTVYSPFGPTNAAPNAGGCDTSIGQGITISVPVYVGGNLCMGQNAVITKPVYVGGYLFFNNKQGNIGSSGAGNTIDYAHVGSYCQVQNTGGQVNPCKSEPVGGNNPNTNIWVTGAPTNLTGIPSYFASIVPPTICWGPNTCTGDPVGGWYSVASPGPLHPCTTTAGTPPTFDNNSVMDGSVTTAFNLTPAASYTCKTAQGELSWNATARVLTVAGTVFVDGPLTMTTSGNTPITYTGTGHGGACTATADCQSVIYANGDISINSEKLCAYLSGNDCDWANTNWDPNKKILIFASNGPNGVTVGPSQTSFQGGLYATNTVATGQSAVTEGPLVSGTKTVVLGQQFGGTFPAITILPLSIQAPPGNFTISPAFNYG
jgi:Tfp pilus assembly protein PilX